MMGQLRSHDVIDLFREWQKRRLLAGVLAP